MSYSRFKLMLYCNLNVWLYVMCHYFRAVFLRQKRSGGLFAACPSISLKLGIKVAETVSNIVLSLQGFLTAMRQEITRAHKGWALDSVVLANDVTKFMKEDVNAPPQEGVYIHGLFLDGAGWDRRNCRLMEPQPKVLFTPLPVVHVYAVNSVVGKDPKLYECPVYKKPRRTDLTYIFCLQLRTMQNPDHWTLRGVALLCDVK